MRKRSIPNHYITNLRPFHPKIQSWKKQQTFGKYAISSQVQDYSPPKRHK